MTKPVPGGIHPSEVETPIGVVDLARARANAARAVEYLGKHGLTWRPHIKTHKCTRMARLQLDAGAKGLTVATPREAEVMATVTDDILLAYPVLGQRKLNRVVALPASVDLKVGLDSAFALRELASASAAVGRTTGVLVEIDAGLGRVGVVDIGEAVELAGLASATQGVEFRGIMFYPGHVRGPSETQGADLRELADRLAGFLEALEAAGLKPEIVSGGSTPTLWRSGEVAGMTEVRAGTAIFNDREQVAIGAAAYHDLAYSVMATVVSTAVAGQAVVDAGSKALSKEARGGTGFGEVLDRPEVVVRALSEEHGVMDLGATDWRPEVGDRVHLVPNHVCVSVNLQDYLLVRDGENHEMWALEARGRGPYGPAA